MNRHLAGKIGENLAARYLENLGYQLLLSNYYAPCGEIDLICTKNQVLYFMEVKYRKTLKYGTPREAMTQRKISKLKRTALHYITNNTKTYVDFKIGYVGILDYNGTVTYDFVENILC